MRETRLWSFPQSVPGIQDDEEEDFGDVEGVVYDDADQPGPDEQDQNDQNGQDDQNDLQEIEERRSNIS